MTALIVLGSDANAGPISAAIALRAELRARGAEAFLVPDDLDFARVATEIGCAAVLFMDEGVASGSADPRRRALSAGHRLVGSAPEAAELAHDKMRAKAVLASAGLATPFAVTVRSPNYIAAYCANAQWPAVVKPVVGAGSRGVTFAETAGEAQRHLAVAGSDSDERAMIEAYVEGRELTVWTFETDDGPDIVPFVVDRGGARLLSVAQKATNGRYLTTTALTPAIDETVRRAFDVLGLAGYARFDLVETKRGVTILEANPTPRPDPNAFGSGDTARASFFDRMARRIERTMRIAKVMACASL